MRLALFISGVVDLPCELMCDSITNPGKVVLDSGLRCIKAVGIHVCVVGIAVSITLAFFWNKEFNAVVLLAKKYHKVL